MELREASEPAPRGGPEPSGRPDLAVDVLVVGGGPAGSAVANLLARRGHRVLLAERERFPRFHIGESLLPYGTEILARLGVLEEVSAFAQPKWGARFLFEPSGIGKAVVFGRGLSRRRKLAFQVRRSELDTVLLRAAARAGAEVREEHEVVTLLGEGESVRGAVLRDRQGVETAVAARLVVDASGRDSLLGHHLRIKQRDPELRQAALFSHFRGVDMGLGKDGGDILIVGTPHGWFWLIPLDQHTTSVGVVAPGEVLRQRRGDLDAFFHQLVAGSPEVSRRLAGASQEIPVVATADFSYRLDRLAGDGWVTVGDAAGFLDPVFSSGVFLALSSAEAAATEVDRALRRRPSGAISAADLPRYERFVRGGLARFRRFILAFYDPAFVYVFCTEPPLELIRRAVISILAGAVFRRGPRLWLGEWLFFQGIERIRRRAQRGLLALPPAPARGSDLR
jgi:flavin-dependent dehydrogenase